MSLNATERRFWRYVGKTPPPRGVDGLCWIWTGAKGNTGVPVWWQDGRTRYVHVWAWEQVNGPKPAPTWQLSPRCGRSACVRPDHRVLRKRGQHRVKEPG